MVNSHIHEVQILPVQVLGQRVLPKEISKLVLLPMIRKLSAGLWTSSTKSGGVNIVENVKERNSVLTIKTCY